MPTSSSSKPSHVRFLLGVSTAAALTCTGCSAVGDSGPATRTVLVTGGAEPDANSQAAGAPGSDAAAPSGEPASGAASPQVAQQLEEIAARVEAATGAQVSLALADASGVAQAGSLGGPLPAWSTIKVPLSVAALRADSSVLPQVQQAITVSDNASAESLWASLGSGETAASAVQTVLAEGGDTSTVVNPTVTRPGFSAFGQTMWPTASQAAFARSLPALSGGESVFAAMGNIAAGQDYGLGQIPGASFKGGWGPNEAGSYLVRQFGLVGDTGVVIATIPADGTYTSGQAVLSQLATEIQAVLAGEDPSADSAATGEGADGENPSAPGAADGSAGGAEDAVGTDSGAGTPYAPGGGASQDAV